MFKSKKSASGLTKSSKYFDQLRKAKPKTEKITLEDAKPQLDEILDFLEICEDYTTAAVGDALNDLVTIPEDMSAKLTQEDLAKNRGAVGVYLQEKNYATLFVKIVTSLKSHVRVTAKVKVTDTLKNFKSVLRGFCNYTAWCPQLQKDFGTTGGIAVLFPLLEYIDKNLTQCDPKSKAVVLIKEILLFLIPICQNCIKYCPENLGAYRAANAFQILSNIKSTDKNVKLLALLTLAYVVDDKQSQSLSKSHDCIQLLTEMLEECLKSPDHSIIIHPMCYSIREILDGLNHLTINDENKVEMKKHGGVKIISQMVEDEGFSDEEKQLAVNAFQNLAFVKSIRETSEVQDAVKSLKKIASSDNKSLREASKYALFEINEKEITPEKESELRATAPPTYTEAVAEGAKSNLSGHVMISYNWGSKDRAQLVRDKLKESGYNVWFDEEKMAGDLLEAMADAVEKSAVVLICLSEKYKDSQNCRSEAQYAYKRKRPVIPLLVQDGYDPDGWLGLIVGTKLYYKFCSDKDTDVEGLLKGIREIELSEAKK